MNAELEEMTVGMDDAHKLQLADTFAVWASELKADVFKTLIYRRPLSHPFLPPGQRDAESR